jgi:hypothetical protein
MISILNIDDGCLRLVIELLMRVNLQGLWIRNVSACRGTTEVSSCAGAKSRGAFSLNNAIRVFYVRIDRLNISVRSKRL